MGIVKKKYISQYYSTKQVKSGFRFCIRKIEIHWRKNLKVEALLYMSMLIEFFLKESISHFEKIVEGSSLTMQVAFNPRNVYGRPNVDDQPLGYLINLLNSYTTDKGLIRALELFAKKRNDCIHKVFGNKISEINSDLVGFDAFFLKLLTRILELNVKLLSHEEKMFHHICDDCFMKEVSKVKL